MRNARPGRNRRSWRFFLLLTSLSICPILLCSCLNSVQLNERAIVQAVGLDLDGDGLLRLTMQVFSPSTGGGGSINATADNAKIIEASGATVSEAIQNATLLQGKQLFVGHNRIILIGSELARRGMEQPLSYFASSTWSRQNVHVAVAEKSASDILKAKINQGMLPAETLEKIVENTEKNGMMKSVQLYEFLKAFENNHESSILPIMTVSTAEAPASEKKEGEEGANTQLDQVSSVSIVGTAVFTDAKMTGQLDREESRGLLWVLGDVEQTILTVSTDKFETAALRVYQSDSKLVPTVQDGAVSFTLKVRCQAAMGDSIVRPGQTISLADVDALARAGEAVIRAESGQAFRKAAGEYHADIFNLGDLLWQKDVDLWRERQDDWQQRLSEVEFNTEATIELDRVGLEFKETDREATEALTQ